jgi:hypothetical protein
MTSLASGTLARFQDAFARALLEPGVEPAPGVAALAVQPAFAVYRNTVVKGCIDALRANYPVVARLVGEEWFRAAAAVYVREALPSDPALLNYGTSFADFLARFPPAADFPYLPGCARLDRLWTDAHISADEAALDPAALARLAPDVLAETALRPHSAARWAWFEEAPVYTIWSRNRAEHAPDTDIDWKPEGALLVRPRDAVGWIALDAAGCAFLDACAAGWTLAGAAQAALKAQDSANISRLLAALLGAGAIGSMSHTDVRLETTE